MAGDANKINAVEVCQWDKKGKDKRTRYRKRERNKSNHIRQQKRYEKVEKYREVLLFSNVKILFHYRFHQLVYGANCVVVCTDCIHVEDGQEKSRQESIRCQKECDSIEMNRAKGGDGQNLELSQRVENKKGNVYINRKGEHGGAEAFFLQRVC